MKQFLIGIFLISLISGCGGGSGSDTNDSDNGDTSENITGNISLAGDDTAIVGAQLSPLFIDSFLAIPMQQPDYIVISTASIVNPTPADALNGFTLVVTDDSAGSGSKFISMAILVNGTQYDYGCTTPVTTFIECGGINNILLDIGNSTVTLTGVTVTNANTSTILTMNGTLSW